MWVLKKNTSKQTAAQKERERYQKEELARQERCDKVSYQFTATPLDVYSNPSVEVYITLAECDKCFALVKNDIDNMEKHLEWHARDDSL